MTPNPVPARGRTPGSEVEGAVLDAASRLLAAGGPDALSIRRIAAEADVAPMSIYNRFDNKAGILDALFRRGFDRLGEAFRTVDGNDPIENLRIGARRYRELALSDPGSYAVMFDHAVADYEPSLDCKAHGAAAFNALVDVTEAARQAGYLGQHKAFEIAQIFWAACHGAVSLELRGMGFVADREANYTLLTDTLLAGFATEPPTESPTGG